MSSMLPKAAASRRSRSISTDHVNLRAPAGGGEILLDRVSVSFREEAGESVRDEAGESVCDEVGEDEWSRAEDVSSSSSHIAPDIFSAVAPRDMLAVAESKLSMFFERICEKEARACYVCFPRPRQPCPALHLLTHFNVHSLQLSQSYDCLSCRTVALVSKRES